MTDDVVEPAELRSHLENVRSVDPGVAQPEGRDGPPPLVGLSGRALDADAVDTGQVPGQRDQVTPRSAADLQHAAAVRIGCRDAEQPAEHREVGRVGIRVREAAVGDLVVAVGHLAGLPMDLWK